MHAKRELPLRRHAGYLSPDDGDMRMNADYPSPLGASIWPSLRRLASNVARLCRGSGGIREAPAEANDRLLWHWVRHRPEEHAIGGSAVSANDDRVDDRRLVTRLIAAYRAAAETDTGSSDSYWLGHFAALKRPIHDLLLGDDADAVARVLRAPKHSTLLLGMDDLTSEMEPSEDRMWRPAWLRQHQTIYDNMWRLAEGIGVRRLEHPEHYPLRTASPPDVEVLLSELDAAFGFRIDFPNPFAGEIGLATTRGVASYRAIQSLYQAWRIRRITVDQPGCRILEIGAGLGRTAYYVRRFGIKNYTIVDLPITNVAQTYFLGRLLGDECLQLYGESAHAGAIRILPPSSFFDSEERFDLVVNVDSLTEMAPETARHYWTEITKRTALFLSINHEANYFTVRDLYAAYPSSHVCRSPYWMRRGYVEELIRFE